jgi:hypothetical protein
VKSRAPGSQQRFGGRRKSFLFPEMSIGRLDRRKLLGFRETRHFSRNAEDLTDARNSRASASLDQSFRLR